MSVEVVNLQGGGGALKNITFSDSLIGADQPFFAGQLWLPVFLDSDNTTTAGGASGFQSGVNRTGTGLQLINPFGAGFVPKGLMIPYAYNVGAARTRKQFVQYQVISNPAGLISRPAGICYANPNAGDWYEVLMVTEVAQFAVNRFNAGIATPLIVQSPTTAYVNNDTVKMTCDALTTPGVTAINLFINGVLVATNNDNSGSRLTNGVTGLEFSGANPAVSTVIANYIGGGF